MEMMCSRARIMAGMLAIAWAVAGHAALPLSQVFHNVGAPNVEGAKAVAHDIVDAHSQLPYRFNPTGHPLPFPETFVGYFRAATPQSKLAIFSDDGCNVVIDDAPEPQVGNYGRGQHLPSIDTQSFVVVPFPGGQDAVAGRQYKVEIKYSNTIFTGPADMDGCALFACEGGGIVTDVPTCSRPDLSGRVAGTTTTIGNGVYESAPSRQALATEVDAGGTAVFYLRVGNDGDMARDLRLVRSAAPEGWNVVVYDAENGGADISADVAGVGWMAPGMRTTSDPPERVVRVEVTPGVNVAGGAVCQIDLNLGCNRATCVTDPNVDHPSDSFRVTVAVTGAGDLTLVITSPGATVGGIPVSLPLTLTAETVPTLPGMTSICFEVCAEGSAIPCFTDDVEGTTATTQWTPETPGLYVLTATATNTNDGNVLTSPPATRIFRVNAPPVAADDALELAGDYISIPVGDLLANDHDPDGQTPTFVELGIPSPTAMLAVQVVGAAVRVVRTGGSGEVSIPYTIADADGATAQATLTVTLPLQLSPLTFRLCTDIVTAAVDHDGSQEEFVIDIAGVVGTPTFTLQAGDPSLFLVQPSLDSSYGLHFRPALHVAGSCVVTVTAVDERVPPVPYTRRFCISVVPGSELLAFNAPGPVNVASGGGVSLPTSIADNNSSFSAPCIRVECQHGMLSLVIGQGVTVVQGDPTGDMEIAISGPIAGLNSSLASLQYAADDGYVGQAKVAMAAWPDSTMSGEPVTAASTCVTAWAASSTAPLSLPSGPGDRLVAPLAVVGVTGGLATARVALWVDDTDVSQLDILLQSPDGTVSIPLVQAYRCIGPSLGIGEEFGDMAAFADGGADIAGASAPYVGVFAPATPLVALAGMDANGMNGEWQLIVQNWGTDNTGTLGAWYLALTTTQ